MTQTVRDGSRLSVKTLVHEAYAGHFILTNLGIEPAEVFVEVVRVANVSPAGLCAVVIARRGELQCTIPIAPVSLELGHRFIAELKRFIASKRTMAEKELTRICHGTEMWRRRAEVIEALIRKGFDLEPGRMSN